MCSTRVTPTAPKSDFSETSQERSRRRGRGSDSLASLVDRGERFKKKGQRDEEGSDLKRDPRDAREAVTGERERERERGGGGEVRFARDQHATVRGLREWDERDVSHEVGFTRERDP
ncbi:hypothetical protein BHM03_00052742 [Ensete ventricosum]|nr:hypothetical protein BHM03_00052742 [Ensete ventricosum]